MNFRTFYDQHDPDPELAIKFLASILVRDATLGYLVGRGILQTGRNYLRYGNLCCKEAQRFMRRLGMTRTPWDPDHLVRMGTSESLKFAAADLLLTPMRDPAAEASAWRDKQKDRKPGS